MSGIRMVAKWPGVTSSKRRGCRDYWGRLFAFAKNGAREAAAEHTVQDTEALKTPGTVLARSMAVAEKLLAVSAS